MAESSLRAQSRTVKRFQENSVHETGVFVVDSDGCIWKNGKRAERRLRSGYLQITVQRNGVRYYTLAHRLVWRALVGPIPEGMAINHKNGVKYDNRMENLEVVTYSENMKHAHRTGLLDEHGERNPSAKLSDLEVEQIRDLYATGNYTMEQLGRLFGVRFQQISRIVRGQRRSKQGGVIIDVDCRHVASARDPENGRFIAAEAAQ